MALKLHVFFAVYFFFFCFFIISLLWWWWIFLPFLFGHCLCLWTWVNQTFWPKSQTNGRELRKERKRHRMLVCIMESSKNITNELKCVRVVVAVCFFLSLLVFSWAVCDCKASCRVNEFYSGRKPTPLLLLLSSSALLLSFWRIKCEWAIDWVLTDYDDIFTCVCARARVCLYVSVLIVLEFACFSFLFVPFLGTCPHMENQITNKPDILCWLFLLLLLLLMVSLIPLKKKTLREQI